MQMIVVLFALVLIAWPLACFQAVSMTGTSLQQIDERKEDGLAGVGFLLGFFIRQRWWVSYAGAAILMLAIAL
ncbi:MAG: hypothetical protein EOO38_08010 [Cytophagaceae bacterium]|nr:MAG: hypothetical protein EOO38_08010 [Cytophagaceae bacterium]